MKKTTLIMASIAAVVAANAQDIGVRVDGRPVRFEGTKPSMANNSVLVPLRGVFEEMGATVRWNQELKQVTATKGEKTIRLVIGERFADVDGKAVQLNTPAQNVNGSTLVPLRFVSEALGAQVRWNPQSMVVMVNTDGTGRAQPIRDRDRDDESAAPVRRDAIATLYKATVIPVKLTTQLSSNESRQGDRFTATVDASNGVYGDLPSGTKIEGRVVTATKKKGKNPGMLELAFDKLTMPDGSTQDLSGTLVSLDDKDLKKDADGRIVATGKARDNKGAYAGYGAGAGAIIGVLSKDNTKGTVTKTILGGLLGLGAGALEKSKKDPSDVKLDEGTKFGVRLDEDVVIYRNR